MISVDLKSVCDKAGQNSLKMDLLKEINEHDKINSSQSLDKKQNCGSPLVIKKEIESDEQVDEGIIDLSIVKEEVLDIDEMVDYTWQEEMIAENNGVEEDKTYMMAGSGEMQKKSVQRRRRMCRTTPKPKHWCSICKCKQESAYALAVHRRKLHLNDARFKCAYCTRFFFHHSNRNKHQLTHFGPLPRHHCKICDRSFARKYGLDAHVRSEHTGERPYVCEDCGMTFTRDGCYRIHRYIHTGQRPHSCPTCKGTFSSKSDLDRHKRVHTGEKPFSCDKCQRRFRLKGQLRLHLQTHTGEKPVACGLCPKTFRRGTNIVLHRESHIANSAVLRIHKCKICHREFSRKGNLKSHLDRHAETKTLKCSHCSSAFKNKGDLVKHMNIHTREKVYICDTCGKSFLRKGRLRMHMKTHLFPKIARETTCKACGRQYKFPCQLKIHQKSKKCRTILRKLAKENK